MRVVSVPRGSGGNRPPGLGSVARTEEEILARACERLSTGDLLTLEETMRRLEELDAPELGWEGFLGELSQGERVAFESAYSRYQQAKEEARAGR